MMGWLRRRMTPAPQPRDRAALEGVGLGDLKRTVRRAVLDGRRQRVTAALSRCAQRGQIAPIPPRDQVVACVISARQNNGERP